MASYFPSLNSLGRGRSNAPEGGGCISNEERGSLQTQLLLTEARESLRDTRPSSGSRHRGLGCRRKKARQRRSEGCGGV